MRSINARTLEVNNLLLGYTAYVGVLTNRKSLGFDIIAQGARNLWLEKINLNITMIQYVSKSLNQS